MDAILALQGLTTTFGGLPAVRDVTLAIARGRITAVIGPNGAGKSTLLKTISGLHTPSSGRVTFEGADITGLAVHAIRRRGIASVQQSPRPIPTMTVRENAAVGAVFGTPGGRRRPRAALADADAALELVGLAGSAGSAVGTLRTHELRLLDLARALAGRPRLLLLDEVMAGLHPGELEAAVDLVRRVRDEAGITIVWVEHVMRAVRALADDVAVLHLGELLATGPPEAVMADEVVIDAYLGT